MGKHLRHPIIFMATVANRPKSNQEVIPQGTHIAILYQIIHLGTQKMEWKGDVKEMYKIRLTFELPFKKKEFGGELKPFVISKEVTLSMGQKSTLRKLVEGMIGSLLSDEEAYGFDIETLLGKACLIRVVHQTSSDGGVYSILESISPIMEGQTIPEQFNKSAVLSFDVWNKEMFEKLPDFIKNKITTSPEYSKKFLTSTRVDDDPIDLNSIPF